MVIALKENTRLKLELDGGIVNNKAVRKSKTFSNVNNEVADEDLHTIGKELSNLQSLGLLGIKRLEEISLIEE